VKGLPNKLAHLRKIKGLTQEELAKKVGVSRVHIWKIESGALTGSIKLLARIAKELDCSIDEIFFTHDDNSK
jgi:putative transcriptional regulator